MSKQLRMYLFSCLICLIFSYEYFWQVFYFCGFEVNSVSGVKRQSNFLYRSILFFDASTYIGWIVSIKFCQIIHSRSYFVMANQPIQLRC